MKVQVSREKHNHEFRHPMLKILYEDAYLIVVEKKRDCSPWLPTTRRNVPHSISSMSM